MPAVECEDLVIRYGATTAVDGVSFSAEPGEVVAILGPNGAGKTSTVECLEGYRSPASGRVRVLGLDPLAEHRALVARVGVMLQRGGVYPMLGPRRVVELFAGYYRDPEPADHLLDLVGLRRVERTPWRHLSGGEQQRLSLALALVGRPEVVFLDEPTSGVDPAGRAGVREVIAGLRSRSKCVVVTTHELSEAERLADRVVIVRHGRVLADGAPGELAASGGPPSVRFVSRPGLDVDGLGRAVGAPVTEDPPGSYRIDAPSTARLTAGLAGWLADQEAELLELRTAASLEETYLALVGTDPAAAPEPTPRRRRPRTR
ncbi:MAG: ABC transporter ATP-binding protein [Acidimicrobiales bacterium]